MHTLKPASWSWIRGWELILLWVVMVVCCLSKIALTSADIQLNFFYHPLHYKAVDD